MKSLVVLTGAGISAASGLKTFRDGNGLWEEYPIEQVASIEGWQLNPKLVLEFYNKRRDQARTAESNQAHYFIADLENNYDVNIVTQNVDDLHERAGSSSVLHLHGRLEDYKCVNNCHFGQVSKSIEMGDNCANEYQLRPDIVWFGEDVPNYSQALDLVRNCDVLLIIGTSLQVYPAANLAYQAEKASSIILVDPNASEMELSFGHKFEIIDKPIISGLKELSALLD
ncbi:NAD-dependent deacylase [Flavobacteriaceae bacterium]|nr:NAD-dependent deacylase [Flavobacteriaceae bacterium]